MRLTVERKALVLDGGEKTTVHAVLSRRNLLALLTKLDMEGSARTIYSDDACVGDIRLAVTAEDDEAHYSGREFPPGPMHPQTEDDIRRLLR